MAIRAYVFDAYGTLYDVQSVMQTVEAVCPSRGEVITQLWRLKQLEYTWLRTIMDSFVDFEVVTRESLIYALRAVGVDPEAALVRDLERSYLRLALAADAKETLIGLAGHTRAIFSNGSRGMLAALVEYSGVAQLLEHVVSVDAARAFKPSPRAYALVEPAIGVAPQETLFVSSNGFDIVGAKRAGFEVAWVRYMGGPGAAPRNSGPTDMFKAQRLHEEQHGARADYVVNTLADVLTLH